MLRRRKSISRPSMASVRLEAIADGFHRGDPAPGVAELRAQPADVHVHGPRLDLVGARVAPDAVQEVLAREDAAGGPEERVEEAELFRRERERPPGERDDVAGGSPRPGARPPRPRRPPPPGA